MSWQCIPGDPRWPACDSCNGSPLAESRRALLWANIDGPLHVRTVTLQQAQACGWCGRDVAGEARHIGAVGVVLHVDCLTVLLWSYPEEAA